MDQNVYRDQAGADASDDPEGGLTRGGRRLVLNCALTPHEMRVVAERFHVSAAADEALAKERSKIDSFISLLGSRESSGRKLRGF